MEWILFVISLLIGVASIVALIYFLAKFIKDRRILIINKSIFVQLLTPSIAFGVAWALFIFGCGLVNFWTISGIELFEMILGGFLFGFNFCVILVTFIIRYYKTNLSDELQIKWVSYALFISIPLIILGFLLFMEGCAAHFTYPLTNGISFTSNGIVWTTYNNNPGGFHIAFYGVIIVAGAIIVYFICDHKFYQKYHKHGLLDTCFLIAFPMGIIGARLWYCLVLQPTVYLNSPAAIFQIWDGGLAIMGGAILGVATGVAYMLLFRKYINLRWAIDIVVPTILIAQAIGRWGNFFNHEVYGVETEMSSWFFIPTFIRNQMAVGFNGGLPASSKMFVPLFLIESCTNLTGYFIIRYAIGKPLKKWLALGDLGCCYFIWYGITRAIMEPMRNQNGGNDYFSASWYTSFVLIGIGVLGIVAFQLYEFLMHKHGKTIKGI